MRKGKIIEKYVAPRFAEYGYSFEHDTPMAYYFYNADKTIVAEYTLTPDSRFLRMEFSMSYGSKAIGIQTNDLIGVDGQFPYELLCEDNEAFLKAAAAHTDHALQIVLPILDRVNLWAVPVRYEQYVLLAKDPEGRALSFAKQHGLDTSYTAADPAWIKDWFVHMLPDDPVIRDYIFQENIETLIDFISYVGEVWRKKLPCSSRWGWLPSFWGRFSQPLEYGILYEKDFNGEPAADFLAEFLCCWNFYGVIKGPFSFFQS